MVGEYRRERRIGDQWQEPAVLTTGVDPAEIGTRVLSRRTDEHTAPGGDVVCACPIKGSGRVRLPQPDQNDRPSTLVLEARANRHRLLRQSEGRILEAL